MDSAILPRVTTNWALLGTLKKYAAMKYETTHNMNGVVKHLREAWCGNDVHYLVDHPRCKCLAKCITVWSTCVQIAGTKFVERVTGSRPRIQSWNGKSSYWYTCVWLHESYRRSWQFWPYFKYVVPLCLKYSSFSCYILTINWISITIKEKYPGCLLFLTGFLMVLIISTKNGLV